MKTKRNQNDFTLKEFKNERIYVSSQVYEILKNQNNKFQLIKYQMFAMLPN